MGQRSGAVFYLCKSLALSFATIANQRSLRGHQLQPETLLGDGAYIALLLFIPIKQEEIL
jgi:hypothetical protein